MRQGSGKRTCCVKRCLISHKTQHFWHTHSSLQVLSTLPHQLYKQCVILHILQKQKSGSCLTSPVLPRPVLPSYMDPQPSQQCKHRSPHSWWISPNSTFWGFFLKIWISLFSTFKKKWLGEKVWRQRKSLKKYQCCDIWRQIKSIRNMHFLKVRDLWQSWFWGPDLCLKALRVGLRPCA